MKYKFSIDGTEQTKSIIPQVYIDGKRLSLVRFELVFETKTYNVDSGRYVIFADGYFPDERSTHLKSYKIDLNKNVCIKLEKGAANC